MNGRHSAKRWTLALALVMALGAIFLTGCGGSSGSSTAAGTTDTTASYPISTPGGAGKPEGMGISDEAQACLKEQGVELPEIKGGEGPPMGEGGKPPQGGEMSEMQKAFEECGIETGELKGGPEGGPPDMNSAAFRKQIKEYAACVRENGYELAEPDFSGEGPVFDESEAESAAFKKASAKCKDLLGGR